MDSKEMCLVKIKDLRRLEDKIKKYEKATRITVKIKKNWWWVEDRPKGKIFEKESGVYLRDPFQNKEKS